MPVPQLTHVFTMRLIMSKGGALDMGSIKSGPHRSANPLTGGFLEGVKGTRGEGLRFEMTPGGSDWILFDPTNNVAHIDVRTHGYNTDGEAVFVHYIGYLKVDDAGSKVMDWSCSDAKTTNPGDHHWWNGPIFETSSQKFKWIETTFFVGQGHWVVEGDVRAVEYIVYAVDN